MKNMAIKNVTNIYDVLKKLKSHKLNEEPDSTLNNVGNKRYSITPNKIINGEHLNRMNFHNF